jgi:rRNA maturation endonuclease Nob1
MKIKKVMEGPRDGEIRCLACFTRFRPKRGVDRAACPSCGMQWRISGPYPKTARLQGPVWEKYPKPGEQILKK